MTAVASQWFESCPAATGEGGACPQFPDGAHRCAGAREHDIPGDLHACTCGTRWCVTIEAPDAIAEEDR